MRLSGISQRCRGYFWPCRSLFTLDSKFFTTTDICTHTNMNTHISCPHITSVDISTQKSVLWTGLICGRLPLRLDWWFKAKLWWFVILFIFSAYIRLIFLLFSVPHFLDFLTFTPSLYTHSFYIIIIFSYNLSNVLSSCHFYCYILIGFPIFFFFLLHPSPTLLVPL